MNRHIKARLLFLLPLVALVLLGAATRSAGDRWWAYVRELADDKYEGRATGSPGHRRAAEYVAEEFKLLGLEPLTDAGYLQPVTLQLRTIREAESSLTLVRGGVQDLLELGVDAHFNLNIDLPPQLEAPAVFVGYGLTVPEASHDDLAEVDLKGKIAVFLRGGPATIPAALRAHYQSFRERQVFLKRAGAVGMVAILDPASMDLPWERYAAVRLQPFMSLPDPAEEPSGLGLAATVNPAQADRWFMGTEHTIAEILELAHSGQPLPRFPLAYTVRAAVSVDRSEAQSENVAAVIRGRDRRLSDEFVVISAHLNHLGVSAQGGGDSIYNGAMDNASGVASLLEIARALKASPPRRSVLFVAVTGEEKGMLGSRYFAANPPVPREAIVANLNLDMFLPLHNLRLLTVCGLEESTLAGDVRAVAKQQGVAVRPDPEPERNLFIRSDQYSFIREGIPSLYFKFGFEKGSTEERIQKEWLAHRYHAPSDDAAQPVDLDAAARFNRLIAALARRIADRASRPAWNPDSFFRRFAPGPG